MILEEIELKKYVSLKKYKVLTANSFLSHEINLEYEDVLADITERVNEGHYYPAKPLGVYSIPKHNYVPRFIPVLQPADNVLYHYLIKKMESKLLAHKPKGVKSYGAYRILSVAKRNEDDQREHDFVDLDELSIGPYMVSYQWYPEYGEFAETIKNYFDQDIEKTVFVKTDIANFYDNIDLRLLENKVRSVLGRQDLSNVNLLFQLLQGVNSFAYQYNYQGKGIPQDETSDCSRLLANFFLYDFDKELNEACIKADCLYVRYCDDMIFMCNTREAAEKIIHSVAEILNKSALSLNSSKTKIFTTRQSFEDYWLYDAHAELTENIKKLNQQSTYNKMQAVVLKACSKERGYQLIKRWAKHLNPAMNNNPALVRKIERSLPRLNTHTVARYIKNQDSEKHRERLLENLYSKARKSNYTGDLLWFRKICETLRQTSYVNKVDRYIRTIQARQ